MRGKTIGTAAALALVAVAGTAPAARASDTVTCSFEATVSYGEGLTAENGDASFRSRSGTANCAGKVGDRTVIGSGPMSLAGSAGSAPPPSGGESCELGAGYGRIALRAPYPFPFMDAETGTDLAGKFEYRRAGAAWEATGSVIGDGGTSNLAIAAVQSAVEGDCMNSPMTLASLSGRLVIGGEAGVPPSRATTACANEVRGSAGRDRLSGTASADLVSGFGERDRLAGQSGADCLFGGTGNDRISGGPGTDAIDCGPGDDFVRSDGSDRVAANCETVRSS